MTRSRRARTPPPPSSHPWMTYSDAHAYEAEAERLGVSAVARAPKGFMREYERSRTAWRMNGRPLPRGVSGGKTWGQKRQGFLARHLPSFETRPTYGRYLALIMWAYLPPGAPPGRRGSSRT